MIYDQEKIYQYLISILKQNSIRYEAHKFPSGAAMIDIWYGNSLYVVQMEEQFIGFSEVDSETGFDTSPDMKFFDADVFKTKLTSVLNIQ